MPDPQFVVIVFFGSLEEAQEKAKALRVFLSNNSVQVKKWGEPLNSPEFPDHTLVVPYYVRDWPISTRAKNTLTREANRRKVRLDNPVDLTTAQFIECGFTEQDILGFRGLGRGSWNEISKYLQNFGIHLKPSS